MLPANCYVVKCPHCRGEKELFRLMSGNTFETRQWSDGKQISPMLLRLSPVQKCPECGRYYLLSRLSEEDSREGDSYSFETGWLSFEQALEASHDIVSPSEDEQDTLTVITIWAYNDIVRNGEEPSEAQRTMFVEYISKILSNQDMFADNQVLLGELYREIGNYDKCISILSSYVPDNDYVGLVVKSIIEKAKAQDDKVFVLNND